MRITESFITRLSPLRLMKFFPYTPYWTHPLPSLPLVSYKTRVLGPSPSDRRSYGSSSTGRHSSPSRKVPIPREDPKSSDGPDVKDQDLEGKKVVKGGLGPRKY